MFLVDIFLLLLLLIFCVETNRRTPRNIQLCESSEIFFCLLFVFWTLFYLCVYWYRVYNSESWRLLMLNYYQKYVFSILITPFDFWLVFFFSSLIEQTFFILYLETATTDFCSIGEFVFKCTHNLNALFCCGLVSLPYIRSVIHSILFLFNWHCNHYPEYFVSSA